MVVRGRPAEGAGTRPRGGGDWMCRNYWERGEGSGLVFVGLCCSSPVGLGQRSKTPGAELVPGTGGGRSPVHRRRSRMTNDESLAVTRAN